MHHHHHHHHHYQHHPYRTTTNIMLMSSRSSSRRMRSTMRMLMMLLLIVLMGVTTATTTISSWFDVADSNHDGMIDHTEYDIVIDKFLAELEHRDAPIHNNYAINNNTTTSFWRSFLSNTETGFWKAFTSSVAMILATEVGDKTFFIAAVLSMKHDRMAVFVGAIAALVLMTILSTAMGLVLPKFLDRHYTHILAGLLFLYFGVKLIYDSRGMEHGKHSEELEEVEEELLKQVSKKKTGGGGTDSDSVLPIKHVSSTNVNNGTTKSHSFWANTGQSVILTAFMLTFVAEWGDRSQIATIALASAKNPIGVAMGSFLGHSICTGAACIGGRMLASSISEKTVSLWGGVIFLLFGFHSLIWEE